MPLQAQQHRKTFRRVLIVVDDDDAARRVAPRLSAYRCLCLLWILGKRKGHDEFAAASEARASRFDRTAVQFDQVAHDGKAESETRLPPLDRTLCTAEQIEDVRQ